MKKVTIALAVSAGIALAPISPLFAGTGVAKDTDAVANAWVPATQAEQEAARGGVIIQEDGHRGQYRPLFLLWSNFCPELTVKVFFCKRREPS